MGQMHLSLSVLTCPDLCSQDQNSNNIPSITAEHNIITTTLPTDIPTTSPVPNSKPRKRHKVLNITDIQTYTTAYGHNRFLN